MNIGIYSTICFGAHIGFQCEKELVFSMKGLVFSAVMSLMVQKTFLTMPMLTVIESVMVWLTIGHNITRGGRFT